VAVSAVVEQVFNTIIDQLSEEIGALLGAPIELIDHRLERLNKDDLFAMSRGRSVISTMVVSGDHSGDSFIITDLKDSVILGGTLIMLPQEQIEENCKLRTFDGEAADAYGEVANIIAGVYTAVFLDMYPESLHFKRTSVEDFVPSKIDPKSDEPFPPNEYVYSSCKMKIEGFDLQNLEVIIPAEILGEETKDTTVNETAEEKIKGEAPASTEAEHVEPEAEEDQPQSAPEEPEDERIPQETVDRVINAAMMQCAEEIGGMLGIELEIDGLTGRYTSKKEFFAKPGKKTIATQMLVSGASEGTAYFLTDLKDAIFFAGTMIMLPAEEISNHIKAGEYGEDEADAFGEVANIISGGLVQNFDEMYPRKFHLKKGDQDLFVPTKVKVEDSTPFPAGEYYVVTGTLSCGSRDLSDVSFICPVDLLHMVPRPSETGWGAPPTEQDAPQPVTEKPQTVAASSSGKTTSETEAAQPLPPIVAIICDDAAMRTHFAESLSETEHQTTELGSNDNFSELRQYSVTGAFLIMTDVNEKGFAAIIKVRSEIPQGRPLIVAGPQWTRSDVIKAVRYGATDIILTPATNSEICEKATTNLKTTCQ